MIVLMRKDATNFQVSNCHILTSESAKQSILISTYPHHPYRPKAPNPRPVAQTPSYTPSPAPPLDTPSLPTHPSSALPPHTYPKERTHLPQSIFKPPQQPLIHPPLPQILRMHPDRPTSRPSHFYPFEKSLAFCLCGTLAFHSVHVVAV